MCIQTATKQCYIMQDKTKSALISCEEIGESSTLSKSAPSQQSQQAQQHPQRQPQGRALQGFMKTLLQSKRMDGEGPSSLGVSIHVDTITIAQCDLLLVSDNAKSNSIRQAAQHSRPTVRRYKSQPLASSHRQPRRRQQTRNSISEDVIVSTAVKDVNHVESRWQSMNKQSPSCAGLVLPTRRRHQRGCDDECLLSSSNKHTNAALPQRPGSSSNMLNRTNSV